MRNKNAGYWRGLPFAAIALALLIAGCDGCDDPDLVIISNDSGNEIGLLVDGADASGDFTDMTFVTTDTTFEFSFDVLERSDGKEEVCAFTQRRPPFARNPGFFHEGHDVYTIPFEDEIVLDFSVWVVHTTLFNPLGNRINETLDALEFAEERWKEERMGLLVGDVVFHVATDDPDANDDDILDHEDGDNDYTENLASEIGFDPGRINIYLVRRTFGSKYFGLGEVGGDQIAMGLLTGSADLLMHEMGHNFTLDHTDDDANFNLKNVGISAGGVFVRRQFFTEGQVFRCHFDPSSAINAVYNARPGLYTTNCGHTTTATPECPEVQKRIFADDNLPPN